jgi:UDP-GlcNAc:undecaprenyl-phosphate GlcNAc-1-phosphate transferase
MFEGLRLFLLPATSFLLTLLLIPVARRLATRWGCVSFPSTERWHRRPTPYWGGVAFFVGFLLPALVFSPAPLASSPFFLVAFQMFILGVYDDLHHINPVTKLVGQIIAAATALFFGYSLHFFTWPLLDALLTALWIISLTNALNLLDNMDGLAGGIGLIAALYLAFLFHQYADLQHTLLTLSLSGALVGFLVFNFHPASIFMGDAGSLFLGSALSLLTVHAQGQASSILSLVAVPTLILFVPILDTTLVSLTRLRRGQAVSQGGKDHSSHRLVILGLSEPKAVLLLYGMAALSGATAVLIEWLSYTLSLVLVPFVVLSLTLFTAYLAQIEIVSEEEGKTKVLASRLPVLLTSFTYKRRLLEVVLDFFLIAFAYYLAFVLRFDFHLEAANMRLYVTSLPVVLTATYSAFFLFGVYRGVWRHTGLEDLMCLAKGVGGGTLLAVLTLLLSYRFVGYSRVVFILYPLVLFLGMAGSRLSFRLFGLVVDRLQPERVPVLIYGAGDGGELVARECHKNPRLGYQPIGFLDDDPYKQGVVVYGLPVLGGVDKLAEVLEREKVQGLIISSARILANGNAEKARTLCQGRDIWIRRLRLEFVEE